MVIISKISKGSKMDQIYIPKNRHSLEIGDYVIIKPVEAEKSEIKPYFYNIEYLEPIKMKAIASIMNILNKSNPENIIITGSFLEKGFIFNDIDLMIITEKKSDEESLKKQIKKTLGLNAHILVLDNKSLTNGFSTDPLYQLMLSKCISKKRLIFKIQNNNKNYKILDLHLLKSKTLVSNFDILNGKEKYNLTRNMIAISLFLKNIKINKEIIDKEIKNIFKLKNIDELKNNMIDKKNFLKKYKEIYKKTFNEIMSDMKDGAK